MTSQRQQEDASKSLSSASSDHTEHTESYDRDRFDDESPTRRTLRFKQPDEEHEEYTKVQPCDEADKLVGIEEQEAQPPSWSSSAASGVSASQQVEICKFKQFAPKLASTVKTPESPYQSRDMKDYSKRMLEMRKEEPAQEYKLPKTNISEAAHQRTRQYQADSSVQDQLQKAIDGIKGMTIDRLPEKTVLDDLRALVALKPEDLHTLSDKTKQMVNQLSHLANVQLSRVGESTHDITQHFKDNYVKPAADSAKQLFTGGEAATRPPEELSSPLPGTRHKSAPHDLSETHVVTGRRCPTKQAHHDKRQHQQALENASQFDSRALNISQQQQQSRSASDERPTLERQEQTASITVGATDQASQLKHSISQPAARMTEHLSDVAQKAKTKAEETGQSLSAAAQSVVHEIQDKLTPATQPPSVPLVERHERSLWEDINDVSRRLAYKLQTTGGTLKEAMEEVANEYGSEQGGASSAGAAGRRLPRHDTSLPVEVQQHPPKKQGMEYKTHGLPSFRADTKLRAVEAATSMTTQSSPSTSTPTSTSPSTVSGTSPTASPKASTRLPTTPSPKYTYATTPRTLLPSRLASPFHKPAHPIATQIPTQSSNIAHHLHSPITSDVSADTPLHLTLPHSRLSHENERQFEQPCHLPQLGKAETLDHRILTPIPHEFIDRTINTSPTSGGDAGQATETAATKDQSHQQRHGGTTIHNPQPNVRGERVGGGSDAEKEHGLWCKMKRTLSKLAYGEVGSVPQDERKTPAKYDKPSQPQQKPSPLAETRVYRASTTAPPSAETSPQFSAQREYITRPRTDSEQDRYDASIFPPTSHQSGKDEQSHSFEPAPVSPSSAQQHSLEEIAAHQRRAPVHHLHGSRI